MLGRLIAEPLTWSPVSSVHLGAFASTAQEESVHPARPAVSQAQTHTRQFSVGTHQRQHNLHEGLRGTVLELCMNGDM